MIHKLLQDISHKHDSIKWLQNVITTDDDKRIWIGDGLDGEHHVIINRDRRILNVIENLYYSYNINNGMDVVGICSTDDDLYDII